MAPDHLDLQQIEKKSSKSFKEYAQRWRDMVAEVQPPLTDKEMTSVCINTLRAPFYDRMIGRKNEKRNVKEHCKDQDVEMPIIAKDIEYKKLVTDEEANEFLKIVKQNTLNKAHVGHDISVEKFSGIIGNITSSNSIVFTDDEIPPKVLPVSNFSSTLDALIYTMEFDKESDDEDDMGIFSEILRMVEEEDKVLGPHQELVEVINLGSQEESKEDMSRLNTDIVVHRVPLKPEWNPLRQKLRKMKPDVLIKIKDEVQKKIEAGFLIVSKYPEWVANIIPVPKKDEKVRMCVDYRDLNRANPKDNFPLPHIDMLVDNNAGYSTFSFMDDFSRYNQIKMGEEDREKRHSLPFGEHSATK
ncbi:RNA-directed DNA polymerase (Reverse transcriptase), Ribonuclease H [Cucumis melo var. makuwa]|uniref:RNA-directed DNA polymerase (Reverse transcriptase), Ribonuclease H n=1 Tax=Cucumis melo var. makuwa TaxID=1194695 RepID=A0A5A7TX17_CUCMM|nr:RNA-directed DNA polymerase (Reverse transcriptase), Ribonuclease H [Cucumis melo var. makuwa]